MWERWKIPSRQLRALKTTHKLLSWDLSSGGVEISIVVEFFHVKLWVRHWRDIRNDSWRCECLQTHSHLVLSHRAAFIAHTKLLRINVHLMHSDEKKVKNINFSMEKLAHQFFRRWLNFCRTFDGSKLVFHWRLLMNWSMEVIKLHSTTSSSCEWMKLWRLWKTTTHKIDGRTTRKRKKIQFTVLVVIFLLTKSFENASIFKDHINLQNCCKLIQNIFINWQKAFAIVSALRNLNQTKHLLIPTRKWFVTFTRESKSHSSTHHHIVSVRHSLLFSSSLRLLHSHFYATLQQLESVMSHEFVTEKRREKREYQESTLIVEKWKNERS